MKELKPHPAARLFPRMPDEQFQALKADIKEHGQLEPIVIWKNRILDGVHRYKACKELGVEPKTTDWHGQGSLVTFVVSRNLHRRHLNKSQWTAIGTDMEPLLQKEAAERKKAGQKAGQKKATDAATKKRQQGESLDRQMKVKGSEDPPKKRQRQKTSAAAAAAAVGVSESSVERLKKVKKVEPTLVGAVKAGKVSVGAAEKIVKLKPKKREALIKQAKKEGFKKAMKAHMPKPKEPPKPAKKKPIDKSQGDKDQLIEYLRRSVEDATSLEASLKGALRLAKKLKVIPLQRGKGVNKLLDTMRKTDDLIDSLLSSSHGKGN
jgi:ParB-like chromosome segregation protein Spo0J